VPFDDDPDEDGPAPRAPLPPDDRLWRHPSEVGATLAAPAASANSTTKLWGVAVVAGLIGAALSLGVVAVAGGLGSTVVEHTVTQRVPVEPVAELSEA
jgi:hypothetical protein